MEKDARCGAAWYHIELPTQPNGSNGWVASSALQLFKVNSRIVVDLTQRRLHAYRNGAEIFETAVAVGAAGTPTPVGDFYVDERFILTNPNGVFGPAVLGISAHSEVLHDWAEGGPIALHGTNEPNLIGAAASHGCIRLANSAMQRLFTLAPAGTPVIIRR